MQPFVKRNAPIFIFGGILIVLFVAIALIGSKKESEFQSPALKKVENNEISSVRDTSTKDSSQTAPYIYTKPEDTPQSTNSSTSTTTADANLQALQIKFTEKGFVPVISQGYVGQTVIWTNETDQKIRISQLSLQLPGWNYDRGDIEPGGTITFVLPKEAIWAYVEDYTALSGTIQIVRR